MLLTLRSLYERSVLATPGLTAIDRVTRFPWDVSITGTRDTRPLIRAARDEEEELVAALAPFL